MAQRQLNQRLTFAPDDIQATRSDKYAPGLPIVLPVPPFEGGSFIQPYQNLSGRMPGNGWFPYELASAPFEAVPPGPTRPNVIVKYGGGSTRWGGSDIRSWLRGLFGSQGGQA